MSARNHAIFWLLAFTGFLGFVYLFKAVLLPFVLGIAIAYLLNPFVAALGRMKIARGPAALLMTAVFFIVVGVLLAVLSPLLYKQSLQLIEDAPGYLDAVLTLIEPYSHQALALLGQESGADLKTLLGEHAGTAANVSKQIIQGLAAGGAAFVDLLSVLVFTPIVTYFMMKEWDHITGWAEGLLPRDHKKTILELLKKIDQKLSGFIRGQISVALILGIAYAIALSIAGLKYGFLIGLLSGALSIIPMVGSTVGLLLSVIVAWFQVGEWAFVGIIAAIFIVGQLIEGNILSPKIVGDSVGLHPLWVFFALLAGGSLFGILGMLLAVPIAAVAGVLLAFAIAQYKVGPYFKGAKKPATKSKASKAPKAKKKA